MMKRASAVGDELKTKLKYQTLLDEYFAVQKDYVSQKRKLQAAKQRREKVLAEVRFLRHKHKFLVENSDCNVEDPLHKPNSNFQSNELEQETNHRFSEAVTESLDQHRVTMSLAKNGKGKRRDFDKELRFANTSLNSPVHDKGMGKKIPRNNRVSDHDSVALAR